MKRASVLVVALMMLLSLTVAYATNVPADIAIYKDGSTTKISVLNKAIVQGSQNLVVEGDEATLTFHIQKNDFYAIPWNMIRLSVDFNGDGDYTDASFSGDKVTLKFSASKLKDGKNFYPAKAKTDIVGIAISARDFEFCITK
jgi:hypothetical protein